MIPEGFKPLLAIEQSKVKTQPVNRCLSEKLDGIRCIIFGGVAYSRSLKKIPNKFIQEYVAQHATILEGFDCEIIVGDKNAPDVFNKSTSGVMSQDGEPNFKLWVFDCYHPTKAWIDRFEMIVSLLECNRLPSRVELLQHVTINNDEDIAVYESFFLEKGAEGVMLRDTDAKYKCGRSGTKNPELQKVKRFVDKEFEIIGWEPKYHNTNEAKTNELGRTERSTSKDGMVALDTMGTLLLRTSEGLEFGCGSGFTDSLRAELWEIRDTLAGKLAKVKYFDVGNGYQVPRFPVFQGIRHKDDM
jgi:DNA ligase-1